MNVYIITGILSYLPYRDLYKNRRVNKEFYEACKRVIELEYKESIRDIKSHIYNEGLRDDTLNYIIKKDIPLLIEYMMDLEFSLQEIYEGSISNGSINTFKYIMSNQDLYIKGDQWNAEEFHDPYRYIHLHYGTDMYRELRGKYPLKDLKLYLMNALTWGNDFLLDEYSKEEDYENEMGCISIKNYGSQLAIDLIQPTVYPPIDELHSLFDAFIDTGSLYTLDQLLSYRDKMTPNIMYNILRVMSMKGPFDPKYSDIFKSIGFPSLPLYSLIIMNKGDIKDTSFMERDNRVKLCIASMVHGNIEAFGDLIRGLDSILINEFFVDWIRGLYDIKVTKEGDLLGLDPSSASLFHTESMYDFLSLFIDKRVLASLYRNNPNERVVEGDFIVRSKIKKDLEGFYMNPNNSIADISELKGSDPCVSHICFHPMGREYERDVLMKSLYEYTYTTERNEEVSYTTKVRFLYCQGIIKGVVPHSLVPQGQTVKELKVSVVLSPMFSHIL